MDLFWLHKRIPQGYEFLIEKSIAMRKTIDSTVQTVKRIITELRPTLLDDLGLVAAIEWQVEEFEKRTNIECELGVNADNINLDNLDLDIATAVFRILQEALTNIARHANSTCAQIKLERKDNRLTMEISDNGRGITQDKISDPRSFGLLGIRERAQFLGGQVEIVSSAGRGTTIRVSIPMDQDGEKHDKNPYC